MASDMSSSWVLTIHFHCSRGYVGNRAIIFPLQLLGRHVDHLEAVQFTSLFIKEGTGLDSKDLKMILDTLPLAHRVPTINNHPGPLKNDLVVEHPIPVRYRFFLTGYIWSKENLRAFISFVEQQRKITRRGRKFDSLKSLMQFGGPIWLCDPVMGDNGICYVPSGLLEVYRAEATPVADIMLPNQSELEWLCNRSEDQRIDSLQSASDCCSEMHDKGTPVIVVTSINLPGLDEFIVLFGSERTSAGDRQFSIQIPRLEVYLVGTGDLFSAVFMDELDKNKGRLDLACLRAARVVYVSQYAFYRNGNCIVSRFLCFAEAIQKCIYFRV